MNFFPLMADYQNIIFTKNSVYMFVMFLFSIYQKLDIIYQSVQDFDKNSDEF